MYLCVSLASVHLSTRLFNLPLALGGAAVCHFPQMAVLNAFSRQVVAPLWHSGRPIRVQAVAKKQKGVVKRSDVSTEQSLYTFYTCYDINPQAETGDKQTDTSVNKENWKT